MSEHSNIRDNSSRLRRNMSKLAFRSKEKVMRSIGRSEETKDEILDHYVMLINKQQIQMQKLQRDMKQYTAAVKAMSLSQKAFYDSLYEIYDDDWAGKDVIASCSQRNQLLHDDIFARYQAEVTDVLQNHLTEYFDCKIKVEKRGRKLVDYDAARRALQSLEIAKKPDANKIEKAREHARLTKESYEGLNNHLHEQLPSIYDSRLPICVKTFSSICESERLFSNEVAEMRTKLNNVLLGLKSAFDNGEYHIQRMPPPLDNGKVGATSSGSSTGTNSGSPTKSVVSSQQTPSKSNEGELPPRSPAAEIPSSPNSDPSTHEYVNLQIGPLSDAVRPVTAEEEGGSKKDFTGSEIPTANGDRVASQPIYEEPPNEEDLPSFKKSIPPEVPPLPAPKSPSKSVDSHKYLDLPPNYMFSVQALYQYKSTDEDELGFDKGEIIHIIKHPDPDEQDDGWQMGVRQKDWEEKSNQANRGVFPANFTKPIEL